MKLSIFEYIIYICDMKYFKVNHKSQSQQYGKSNMFISVKVL